MVIGRVGTKLQPLTVCRLAFGRKSQWNQFEDLETLQSKKCRLLVSLQNGLQKKKLRCTFQVETTLGNQYALWCDKILSLDPWTLPRLVHNLNIAVILRVLLRYLTKGLILTRTETSLSLGMEFNKKSEVVTHALTSGRQPCWNLFPSAISGVKNLSTHRFVAWIKTFREAMPGTVLRKL